uniref:Uncharacterized protein n=1 Tax=Caenorhabditis japonica TaxID=281687 RepID=A0A8R1HRT5_CAEJA
MAKIPPNRYFTSLTHGKCTDCRQANASLAEKLEDYNFGTYVLEKGCWRCPNDDCNLSFVFILQQREFYRLKNQVKFDVRPTFLVHTSFNELVSIDQKLRTSEKEQKSVATQISPEMTNAQCQSDVKTSEEMAISELPVKVPDQDVDKDVIFLCTLQRDPSGYQHKEVKREEPEENSTQNSTDGSLNEQPIKVKSEPTYPYSPKRIKFSDVEQCSICWIITDFDSLAKYCEHILEAHMNILRFKCDTCAVRFLDSRNAMQHKHYENVASFSSEISDDQMLKFFTVAKKCFPDKFRDASMQNLKLILTHLP